MKLKWCSDSGFAASRNQFVILRLRPGYFSKFKRPLSPRNREKGSFSPAWASGANIAVEQLPDFSMTDISGGIASPAGR
jgi:hypothetical protein